MVLYLEYNLKWGEMTELSYETMLSRRVRPIEIKEKEELMKDLYSFKNSCWSGRVVNNSITILNTFVQESIESLTNSILLFEMGYFDCAFYSLRSAIDLSTTLIYLSELPEKKRAEQYKVWRNKGRFPMRSAMVKDIEREVEYYRDVKTKMLDFFGNGKNGFIFNTSNSLNEHIHKQGYSEFYVIRNHPIGEPKYDDGTLLKEYLTLFRKTVSIVAVMRLIMDPLPLILMDEEALYRYPDLMNEPFDQDFTSKYLDNGIISGFKKSNLYNDVRGWVMSKEMCKESTFNIVRHHIIDRTCKAEYESQYHLMSDYDRRMVQVAEISEKIINISCLNELFPYYTELPGIENTALLSGVYYDVMKNEGPVKNKQCKNTFFSIFVTDSHTYFIDTNEMLTADEIEQFELTIKRIES